MKLLARIWGCLLLVAGMATCASPQGVANISAVKGQRVRIDFTSDGPAASAKLREVLLEYPRVEITLHPEGRYEMGDLTLTASREVIINGRGAFISAPGGTEVASLLQIVDPDVVKIEGLTFSGKHPEAAVADYLVRVHATAGNTTLVQLEDVRFEDGNGGGLKITDNYPNRSRHPERGARQVRVKNCHFSNVGLYAGVNIRGNHRDVLIDACTGTDPLARQHFSLGKMMEVSAEVSDPTAFLGQVTISNCRIFDANKGYFAQKVRSLNFVNNQAHRLGHKPVYYKNGKPVGVVALKIDDLGKGYQAVVENFKVTETAALPYRQAISLEQSAGVGETRGVVMRNVDADAGLRLKGAGHHRVVGGRITNGSLVLQSEKCMAEGVSFTASNGVYDGVVVNTTGSTIKGCNFVNSQIKLLRSAKQTIITDCKRMGATPSNFVVVDINDPKDPVSVFLENISVPDEVTGLWSGGIPDQSKNIEVRLGRGVKQMRIHQYIKQQGKVAPVGSAKRW